MNLVQDVSEYRNGMFNSTPKCAYYCWMGRESWHAIKKLLNLPFLILKVRYPAIKNKFMVSFVTGWL